MSTRIAERQHRLRTAASGRRSVQVVPPLSEAELRARVEDHCRRALNSDVQAGDDILAELRGRRPDWSEEDCAAALADVEDALSEQSDLANGWIAPADVCDDPAATFDAAEQRLAEKVAAAVDYCLHGGAR